MSDAPRAARLGLLALTFFRESHVDATAEWGIRCKDDIGAFGNRDAFAGERRLIDS
jgi:hypothetical protein